MEDGYERLESVLYQQTNGRITASREHYIRSPTRKKFRLCLKKDEEITLEILAVLNFAANLEWLYGKIN